MAWVLRFYTCVRMSYLLMKGGGRVRGMIWISLNILFIIDFYNIIEFDEYYIYIYKSKRRKLVLLYYK